jgi:sulfur carrier protein
MKPKASKPHAQVAQTFRLNGELLALPAGQFTLVQLLQQHGFGADSVATAVNAQFVPRQAREATQLQAGDEVTVIQPIVGG